MIRNISIIIVTMVFLVACTKPSGHESHNEDKSGQEKKISQYVCPMHPHITSDKPGKCPICGMDLVSADDDDEEEEEEEEAENHEGHQHSSMGKPDKSDQEVRNSPSEHMSPPDRATIKLKLDKRQIIGVKSEIIKKRDLFKAIRAPGRVAFDPELYTAQSEYMEAVRQKTKVKDTPLQEVMRSTNEMIRSAKIKLKVLGLTEGQISQIGKKNSIYKGLIVGDNKENLIYADLFEAEISDVKKGQKVSVSASFLNGKKLKGKVVSVDKVIDSKTRTGKVRIKIEETDFAIRPEAFVSVSIMVPLGQHIAVPRDSILDTGRELFVFIRKGKGRFEPRIITKLYETDEYIAVASGVEADEEVVTSANYMLDSESRLKAVIKGSGASSGHNH